MRSELQSIINDCNNEIADIEEKINKLPKLDNEVRYLTNYALIKASGTVEFVYRSIVADYFSKLSDSRIDTFLEATVRKGSMSAKYEQMCSLLGRFDKNWSIDFKNEVKNNPNGERLIDASNSLVENRHNFAHGKNPTATFLEIKQYYYDVLSLVNILDSVVH